MNSLIQELRIVLPINVGQENVTSTFLDEIKYQPSTNMADNYDPSYTTELNTAGEYLFVINLRKDDLSANASFEAVFYLSIRYFSLPWMINWLVIMLVLIFTIGSLAFFLVVIRFKNKSQDEVSGFKTNLYEVLKQHNE